MGEVVGRRVRDRRVVDLGIRSVAGSGVSWEVATVALSAGRVLGRRRAQEVVDWTEVSELFADERAVVRQAAAIGHLHPAEMAAAIGRLGPERRRTLARALEDERLADLLEELSEDEQVGIVEGLDLERAARVLAEMEADDAADLLGEFSRGRRTEYLEAMDPDEAEPVRRLLRYPPDTAGGLMSPEPVILSGVATVADALARIRDPELPAAMAAQVFVTRPPNETPTGRFLGVAGYQRLLREAPSKPLARCLDDQAEAIAPQLADRDVAARLAAYDAVAIPVVDSGGSLVGAITIDDVLDRVLPDDWRAHYAQEERDDIHPEPVDSARDPRGRAPV